MHKPLHQSLPRVLATLLALFLLVSTAFVGVQADASQSSRLQASINAAQQALAHAKQQASAESTALGAAEQNLTNEENALAAIKAKSAALTKAIASQEASIQSLQAEIHSDSLRLAAYYRASYEQGLSAPLAYILASNSINTFMDREDALSTVAGAGNKLLAQVLSAKAAAQQQLSQLKSQQASLRVAQEQAVTTEILLSQQAQQVTAAANAAATAVAASSTSLSSAQQQLAAYQAEQKAIAAAQAARAQEAAAAAAAYYPALPGSTFSITTNLTQPSNLTATEINQFLAGTALAGLGPAYIDAQNTYHVNARYLVAHSIEESAWGTSAIAQQKNNLFGFEAYNSNPFQDAATFPSFSACIMTVAQYIAVNYLAPTGQYYHGPTLQGMNVDYATDPNWATNIANIANTIPPAGD